MRLIFSLLILAAVPTGLAGQETGDVIVRDRSFATEIGAADAERHPDAVEVFTAGFEAAFDKDYDNWPDGWRRQMGDGYPHYVEIATTAGGAAGGKNKLSIKVNGGAAACYSPPIPIRSTFSYILEAQVRAEGLVRDQVYVSMTFFDDAGNVLETAYSRRVRHMPQWGKIEVGPVTPEHENATTAIIGLHLEPTGRPDLRGVVEFDELWFARLPRMVLRTNSAHNVYTDPQQVFVECEVSGISTRDPQTRFEVIDVAGNVVARTTQRMDGQLVLDGKTTAAGTERAAGYAGKLVWHPPIEDYGFYRVNVAMDSHAGLVHERTVTIAVVRPHAAPTNGEFGWSLPDGDQPVPLKALEQLLTHVGINWLKFPVWFAPQDNARAEQIVRFTERLSFHHIEVIGLLAKPPAELRDGFGDREELLAADIFSAEKELWQPALEPVMNRLSLKIRWWQLGLDKDISFVNYPDLPEKISELKSDLYKFGQEVSLGIGWRWINEELPGENPPWQFLSYSADPDLTPQELETYLKLNRDTQASRWVVIEPLSRAQYSNDVRATDLIHRMLAAKIHGADAIFVPQPFSTDRGLMNDDGTPGELLLPWRTTALALAGAEYLGSITLPNQSKNHIFTRGGEAVMVIWNDTSTEEVVYLGDEVRLTDIWGRAATPATRDHRQVIPVGPLPTFITGVSEPITRMRMSFEFAKVQLPSVFGRPHQEAFRMRNYFPQGVSGKATLITPEVWRVSPRVMNIKMAPGELAVEPFEVLLPFDASSGRQDIRIDFDVTADKNYRFSVYRHLEIGLGDVVVEVATRLNDQGDLEVEQHIINHTDDAMSFKCLLFIPDRRRMRTQVLDLGRGRDTRTYRLFDGEELLGKTLLLRIEEVDGPRNLNYRIEVEK